MTGTAAAATVDRADEVARQLWGEAYGATSKAVYAVVAYYLADCASDEGVGQGGELRRFVEELDALQASGILQKVQVRRARRAVEQLMRLDGSDASPNEGDSR